MDNSKLPAYPVSLTREWREGNNGAMHEVKDDYEGLSKLEAFTMAAMQGLCANVGIVKDTWSLSTNNEGVATDIALAAISIAIATLSELSKQK